MHLHGTDLILSATDLSGFVACPHLTTLNHGAALGGPKPPKFDDPSAEVLRRRGLEHEARLLESYRKEGLAVVEIGEAEGGFPAADARARMTLDAMRKGADVIYQGCLFDGRWLGLPDFLRRVDRGSELGEWSYEVVDAKLAREAKVGAVLQITLYSSLLARLQGVQPEHMHLALGRGDGETERFRYHDFAAYARSVGGRLLAAVRDGARPATTYPEPVEHCDVCRWKPVCRERWRRDDHLSLVAGITRRQRRGLEERGVSTLAGLAVLPLPVQPRLEGVSEASLAGAREQARIQLEGRRAGEPRFELFGDVPEGFGLARLPEPDPRDLFFDIESDPYALDEGLEYLFGYSGQDLAHTGLWALSRAEERRVFEAFIDMVTARLEKAPSLHVYHYGHYEPTALKRLAGRYGTREAELDRLLRGEVFVDLHRVVTQSLRASVESYSLKKLEPLFGYEREVGLRAASSALAHFEAWLALGTSERETSDLLGQIEGYNRDDCLATAKLRDWLEERRRELESLTGSPRPRPPDPELAEESEEPPDRAAELMARLTEGVADDPAERTREEQARWLLAQMLEWHRREKKSSWWRHFEWLACTEEELIRDRSTLGGLAYDGVVEVVGRSHVHRYRFPRQDHGFRVGDKTHDPATWRETQASPGPVWAVDDAERFIDLKRGMRSPVPHPSALIPNDLVPDKILRESLLRLAESVVERGLGGGPERAAAALLLALPPAVGQAPGEALRHPGEETLSAGRRLALALKASVLPVQGPPGSGKTYTGARMILDLLRAGKRVGVTANSHKVIGHLLDEVCKAGREEHVDVTGVQLNSGSGGCAERAIEKAGRNWRRVRDALESGEVRLAGGTAWLWARPDLGGSVDVLVVDEAGQMSLANALVAAPAARSLILLGDPRQLEQPTQGIHPPGADASALAHAAGGALTLPPDRGLFLDRTYRLHPDICSFTSEVFYEGRLEPIEGEGLELQYVDGGDALPGTGLGRVDVEHAGNTNESAEEVRTVRALVDELLGSASTWTDKNGVARPLGLEDILVVAPYNAQVGALIQALPEGARVGTVDKFQGQEAPIVIGSLASSSADTAPRGMEFLFSPNRLNVATSRARCLAVLVASPALYVPACRSVRHMRFANAFCRFAELAV